MADTYKEVRTFSKDNFIIRVHIPDLDDKERERRMKLVKRAAAELLKK